MPNPRSTKLVVIGPPVALRLSADELEAIRYGSYVLRWYLDDLAFRSYDFDLCERLERMSGEILRLAKEKKTATVRVHADALALAAIMFSLRMIPREIRRDRIPLCWPANTDYRGLLRRLERHRRRAKHLWLKLGSADCYRRFYRRWHRFLDGVHFTPPRRKSLVRADYQTRVDFVLKATKELLAAQEPHWVPLDSDLRPMVRAALRHVRRERAPITMKDLICNTAEGRSFLSEYVGRQVSKLFWQRMRELEAQEPPSSEEDDDVFAAIREFARDKARANTIIQNRYP